MSEKNLLGDDFFVPVARDVKEFILEKISSHSNDKNAVERVKRGFTDSI